MKKYFLGLAAVLVVLAALKSSVRAKDAETADPAAAIQKTAEAFIDAFQKGDAKAVAAFWTPDGDYIDQNGRVLKGRKAIEDEFTQFFSEAKNLKLRIEAGSLQFTTPEVAVEDGVSSVMTPDGAPPSRARYTNVLVKKEGQWFLSSVREAPFVPPNNYEHLRPLEWMMGEWVDTTPDGHVAHITFDFTPDENFIVSTRAVAVKDAMLDNGSQRIGWDPALKTIRSWNFESDGGFGESTWTRDGDKKWIIKTSSVLQSGAQMVATNTITRVDPDTVTWQATEQQINGKPIPDSAVVKLKRL